MYEPLVSVGIPTYNRPEGLRKTLEQITGQTYTNLEIIVSDNHSPGYETRRVAKEFWEKDSRIKYYRQEKNLGQLENFNFVLVKSTGEYFLWAADDDIYEPFFIQDCQRIMEYQKNVVAVTTKARYFDKEGKPFGWFNEGLDHYHTVDEILGYGYGNLFYSLYRRSVLPELTTLFELPLFLHVISEGTWVVLPCIGLWKQTTEATYRQARWEAEGGELWGTTSFRELWGAFRYHLWAQRDIIKALLLIRISKIPKSSWNLWKHFYYLFIRHKPIM